uniref:RNA helicase n=1 Tax=Chrysotila carterae TaxID=13221 RepID=A0A6T0E1R0_CHRCT
MNEWARADWRDCVGDHDVLVGTPAVFLNALSKDFIQMSDIALLIFDECHQAVGKSPMASIMKEFYWRAKHGNSDVPRILGLTASILHGKLKGIENKRRKLETILDAAVYKPPSYALSEDDTLKKYERVQSKSCGFDVDQVQLQLRECFVRFSDRLKQSSRIRVHSGKAFASGIYVVVQSGMCALAHYMGECILYQLQREEELRLERMAAASTAEFAERMTGRDTAVELTKSAAEAELTTMKRFFLNERRKFKEVAAILLSDEDVLPQLVPQFTPKCLDLLDILETHLAPREVPHGTSSDSAEEHMSSGSKSLSAQPRGLAIVFVERVALTWPLAHAITQYFTQKSLGLKAEPVSGSQGMCAKEREAALTKFKQGEVHVLVATAALEEGIDVADCRLIVRYSEFQTTKSHIQGSGRARRSDAKLFYFENDPQEEMAKEKLMAECAQNVSLELLPATARYTWKQSLFGCISELLKSSDRLQQLKSRRLHRNHYHRLRP